ncbi:MAG: radical SAM protein [Candidatus Thermoplasmatota archaeon]|nr:radical SAM protein [Candidatus Thermoplasmatota archaeon]
MGISKTPYFCNYFVTYRCNSKCQFCNFWRNQKLLNKPDVKLSDVKKNLDDLSMMGVTVVDFVGGEPLLHKDLPEMLSYAKNLGFFVKLSTNGLLYESRAHELKGNVTRIYASLDTTNADEYSVIRGTDAYDQLVSSIKCAKSMNQDICLISTFTDNTIKNIEQIASFAKEFKINIIFHPCFSYFGNAPLSREHINTIKKYFWHPYIRMSLTDLDFFYNGGNDIHKPSCLAGKSTIDIGPPNDILIPCLHNCTNTIKINGHLSSLFFSNEWAKYYRDVGRMEFCNHCSIDCYFGLSYWDKLHHGFLKANLSYLKTVIETIRPH